MSTENKKKVLVGFGAFAVGLIAVLAIWRPPAFRSEDASGSIGTVQKYHAPQITQKDVILGNEATRHEQQIRYGDFLNDAAKLHALSAQFTANNFDAASAEMDAMRGQVRQQFLAAAKEAVAAAQTLARSNRDQAFARSNKDEALARSDREAANSITALSAILQSGQLSDAGMANFNTTLGALAARFGVKTAADRAQNANKEVASAVSEMRSNRTGAAARMDNATGDLQALNGISLADHVQYLSATEAESRSIARAQDELNMMASHGQGELKVMASRAQGDLKAMAESTSLAAASHKSISGVPMARELSAQADVLEARAAKAMENQLGLLVVIASAFRDIDANLTAARGNTATANVASAAARGGQQYDKAFANLNQAFAGAKAEFSASANAGISAELAALDSFLASAGQAGVKAANVREMANVLANLNQRLSGNSVLAASLAGQQELAMRANRISERAAAARN